MAPSDLNGALIAVSSPYTAADVLAILRERGWLAAETTPPPEIDAWCGHAQYVRIHVPSVGSLSIMPIS